MSTESIAAIESRDNNFGVLRLLFAALVIVSHSPEIIDGNRGREILTRLFGTMSFGEIAVDGFFLISGFLITKSFVETKSVLAFFTKRMMRILPGYFVSFWICVLLIAPFVGASVSALSSGVMVVLAMMSFSLMSPELPGVFAGLPYPALNGSVWTIQYEFACYLAAALLGALGAYTRKYRFLLLILTALCLAANAALAGLDGAAVAQPGVEKYRHFLRFFGVFWMGALFFLFQDKVRFTNRGATFAALMLGALFFNCVTAEAAFAIPGGYLIFWFAFKVPTFSISRLTNRTDISYGVYLYAWPIQMLVAWLNPGINPWVHCAVSLAVACLAGYASWMLVEKPAMNALRANRPLIGATA